ncbi:selenocysteine lyase/cysteine desulfurase [Nitrobacter vulgaris]|nr:selenocysteine lyase/cysteine desulfurase [Nitrobacter vulgaris]
MSHNDNGHFDPKDDAVAEGHCSLCGDPNDFKHVTPDDPLARFGCGTCRSVYAINLADALDGREEVTLSSEECAFTANGLRAYAMTLRMLGAFSH